LVNFKLKKLKEEKNKNCKRKRRTMFFICVVDCQQTQTNK